MDGWTFANYTYFSGGNVMTYSVRLLIVFVLSLPAYSAVAGEWRYDNAVTVESVTPAATSTPAQAQPLMVSTATRNYAGPVPTNNMTMASVRTQFGQPNSEAVPVGKPPINRWYYDNYTVYFELDRVIISVINL